jgi:hypothetical protein
VILLAGPRSQAQQKPKTTRLRGCDEDQNSI